MAKKPYEEYPNTQALPQIDTGLTSGYAGVRGAANGNAIGHVQAPASNVIQIPMASGSGNATGHVNVPAGGGQSPAGAPQSWADQMAALYDQITNRPAFSYDPNSDPLWQNYKDQYTLAGRRAMEDTMGQAAALTGGYGSSYSQAAGQQQYGDYMTRMSAELPSLYAQARSAYDKEGDDLYNRYNMAMNMEQQEYARGRDELADQRYQDELAYAREQDAYNRQQSERSEARNYATYLLQLGIMPSAEDLAAAGMSQQEAAQIQNYYKLQLGGYGGSGGSGGSGRPGGRSGGSGRSSGRSGGSGGKSSNSGSSSGSGKKNEAQWGPGISELEYNRIIGAITHYASTMQMDKAKQYIKSHIEGVTEAQYRAIMNHLNKFL